MRLMVPLPKAPVRRPHVSTQVAADAQSANLVKRVRRNQRIPKTLLRGGVKPTPKDNDWTQKLSKAVRPYMALMSRYLNADGELEKACSCDEDISVLKFVITHLNRYFLDPTLLNPIVAYCCQLINTVNISMTEIKEPENNEASKPADNQHDKFYVQVWSNTHVDLQRPLTMRFADMWPRSPPIIPDKNLLNMVLACPQVITLMNTDMPNWKVPLRTQDIIMEPNSMTLKLQTKPEIGEEVARQLYSVSLRIQWNGPSDQFHVFRDELRTRIYDDFTLLRNQSRKLSKVLDKPLFQKSNLDRCLKFANDPSMSSQIGELKRQFNELNEMCQSMEAIKALYSDLDNRNTPIEMQIYAERNNSLITRYQSVADIVHQLARA